MHSTHGAQLSKVRRLEAAKGGGPGPKDDLYLGHRGRSRTKAGRVCLEVGREVSNDLKELARQLGSCYPVLCPSEGDQKDHLYDKCHRIIEHVSTEGDKDTQLFSNRRRTTKTAVSGTAKHRKEMDETSPGLASRIKPLCHYLRGQDANRLTTNAAYGNGGNFHHSHTPITYSK